ncbi:MAG TPA: chemotaxis protein CheB [Myxococcaceae bacterium]|nr:chemotaxis protein CheB [Myxococcaceae bacterium]
MAPRSKPARVLLVDEALQLTASARPLFDSPELKAVGEGCSYSSMLASVLRHAPNIVVVELTRDNEEAFAAIETVMNEHPTPILVLHSGEATSLDPFRALALGALDVAERPRDPSPSFWRELVPKLVLLAQVHVVRHMKGNRIKRRGLAGTEPSPPSPLVAIAASLGGPRALSILLRMVPKAFPAPICVCQHISHGFTNGLAQWLSSEAELRVVEAIDDEPLTPGTVFLAPSRAHLLVTADGRTRLDDGPARMGFRPSCDALLTSAAEAYRHRAIGVVLTGMGRDGAQGLKHIRMRGGRTIVQDRASCVVFGMPKEAVEIGAAEQILSLDRIAPALIQLVERC